MNATKGISKRWGILALLVVGLVFLVLWLTVQPGMQPLRESTPKSTTVDPILASSTKSPDRMPGSATAPRAQFVCNDKLGCVVIGPNDPIHIAFMFVISGDNSALGLDTKYGAEIAIDDMGGKLFGHVIKFDGQDSACNAEGGQAAAAKIASDVTVVAVIGPSCSTEARVAATIITQAGLTMVSPSSTGPDLTDPAKHQVGFLRTSFNGKVQGVVAAQFAYTQLNLTRAATIDDHSSFAQALAQAFAETFKKLGGVITSEEVVNVGDKDMRPTLTRIAAGKPDLVFYPISTTEGSLIAAQIRDVKGLERTAMLSSDDAFSPDFLKAAGKNTIGMYFSIPDFEGYSGGYQAFVEKYRNKYKVKGTLAPFHAHAYDAMNMVLAALQEPDVIVKESDGTLHVRKQALRNALYATKDLNGLTGTLTCDGNGDCADPKIAVYQVTSADFSKLVLPDKPIWKAY